MGMMVHPGCHLHLCLYICKNMSVYGELPHSYDSILSYVHKFLGNLIKAGGKLHLVCSPRLVSPQYVRMKTTFPLLVCKLCVILNIFQGTF